MSAMFNFIISFISNGLIGPIAQHKLVSAAIAVALIGVGYQVVNRDSAVAPATPEAIIPTVTLITAASSLSNSSFSAIGTIRAISEAQLKAKAGGQVTAVYTEIGRTVLAGAILAQTENARESAALLQAQGAYEAAQAGSAQSDSGVRDAENNLQATKNAAITTYRSAYTAASGDLTGTIDQFFSNPNTTIPGVRISGTDTFLLNTTRSNLRKVLPEWQATSLSLSTEDNIIEALIDSKTNVENVLLLTDLFIVGINKQSGSAETSEAELRQLNSSFTAVRSNLVRNLAALDAARTNIIAAEENVRRANLSSESGTVSLSGAQLKIALGQLRAAQASYENTLIRTPISGVVNALYLKRGDNVTPGTDAAIVANNRGLQVETAINQSDRDFIAVGDSVTINDSASGTISAIAGAVDPSTGKIAVKIGIAADSGLENGSVAKITLANARRVTSEAPTEVTIPLAAIKLLASGPVVFTVNTESTLVAQTVELGPVTGDQVLITSGLSSDEAIISDARGRKAGEAVVVSSQ